MNFAAMVHGGQEFEWGEPVCAGDTITTTVTCKEISERDGKGFYVFESVSTNQDGERTVRGDLDQHRPRSLREERAMAELEVGDTTPRAAGDARRRADQALRRGLRRPEPDPHRRGVREVGRPARLHPARPLLDGPGRPRAQRASPTATRARCKRLAVQFRGMGFPEQEIVVTSTVKRGRRRAAIVTETEAAQGENQIIRNAEAELELG